jgi:hypothetical protein
MVSFREVFNVYTRMGDEQFLVILMNIMFIVILCWLLNNHECKVDRIHMIGS